MRHKRVLVFSVLHFDLGQCTTALDIFLILHILLQLSGVSTGLDDQDGLLTKLAAVVGYWLGSQSKPSTKIFTVSPYCLECT
jgi:hypothetical protein